MSDTFQDTGTVVIVEDVRYLVWHFLYGLQHLSVHGHPSVTVCQVFLCSFRSLTR